MRSVDVEAYDKGYALDDGLAAVVTNLSPIKPTDLVLIQMLVGVKLSLWDAQQRLSWVERGITDRAREE